MSIDDVIYQLQETKPNQIQKEFLIGWLSDLDQRVYKKIISTHEGQENTRSEMPAYNINTPGETQLLIPDENAEIYRWYLEMQIDLTYREMEKYANSRDLFNAAYDDYRKEYNKTHMPKQRALTWNL